jgi:NAD(P)-dependent dehydrogenase (short-subunit alcohol dehydrogenase family)
MELLSGKIAIVTGASRGIGKGIARELGFQGAQVVVTARTLTEADAPTVDGTGLSLPGSLDNTTSEINAAGGEASPIRCDLSDYGEIEALINAVVDQFGRIDILVCNAMPQHQMEGSFWELPVDVYDKQMEIGPRAYYLLARAAAPVFLKQGNGWIVNISSPGASLDFYSAAYCIARAASDRTAQAVASELGQYGVNAVSLWPAFIQTERVMLASEGKDAGFSVPDDFNPGIDANTPDFVGRAIAHLVNDQSAGRFNGKVLSVADLASLYNFRDVDGRVAAVSDGQEFLRNNHGNLAPLAYAE